MRGRTQAQLGVASGVLALLGTSNALAVEPSVAWAAWTASPLPIDQTTLGPTEREALARCGDGDAGLNEVARSMVSRKRQGLRLPELDEIASMQRAAGEPHPWARTWVATGRISDKSPMMAKLDAWLGPAPQGSLRRCGVASASSADGTSALAVVTIDALADLAPLPVRARPGQWLMVEARLRVRATGAEVIVLGPTGPPRRLPTSFDGVVLRAQFAPDRPGEFLLQVIAEMDVGPRPVLEATVFADVEPRAREDRTAPGEDMVEGIVDEEDHLARMVAAARASAGLGPLARDSGLDAIARAHATHMARTRELAHQLGDGDPLERLRAAGVYASYVGENVAHAPTVALAHRSLWASPSHRANLLRREFARVGVAVVHDEQGDAWIVETFASR